MNGTPAEKEAADASFKSLMEARQRLLVGAHVHAGSQMHFGGYRGSHRVPISNATFAAVLTLPLVLIGLTSGQGGAHLFLFENDRCVTNKSKTPPSLFPGLEAR